MLGGYILLMAMIWVMNGLNKLSITITIVFLLTLLAFVWVDVGSYDNSKSLKLSFLMDMRNPGHLISNIMKQIEKRQFEQLAVDSYDKEMHCYECLIVRSKHMHHCQKCNYCIDFHHKHSAFLGKCIGRDNAIAYFWFVLANTVLNVMAVFCLVNCINMPSSKIMPVTGQNVAADPEDSSPSGVILSLVSCLVNIYE